MLVLVPVPLPEIAVLLPEPVLFIVDEVPAGRVLFVIPSVPSDVLVPLELIIVPLFVPPVPSEFSFELLYPCRDGLLP